MVCRCHCQVAAVAAEVEKMFVMTPTWFGGQSVEVVLRYNKVDVSRCWCWQHQIG